VSLGEDEESYEGEDNDEDKDEEEGEELSSESEEVELHSKLSSHSMASSISVSPGPLKKLSKLIKSIAAVLTGSGAKTVARSLSPSTLLLMFTSYWKSLLDPTYSPVPKTAGQDLRLAQERSRMSTVGGGRRGGKKMKRGGCKSLGDLPKLSQ
jgi:hypothetical protein